VQRAGFDPTYKELKQNCLNTFSNPVYVLILPIRNWNLISGLNTAPVTMCFDPTYKELKLSSSFSALALLKCFDPTYKELKPKRFPKLLRQLFRFDPTYKELKPL